MKTFFRALLPMALISACGGADAPSGMAAACGSGGDASACLASKDAEGLRLFDEEAFDGNGRTCVTCHSLQTGTISPEQVRQRHSLDPGDPLFQHDGLDAQGGGTDRIREHATILVELDLPDWVRLADDPEARTVVVRRAVPSNFNIPFFDEHFQWDLRFGSLEQQAGAAIVGHAQALRLPTETELALLAEVQSSARRFFSSDELHAWANGEGPAPGLPEGRSEAEKRGREFFVEAPVLPGSKKGICGHCHSGPLLNRTNAMARTGNPRAPAGAPAAPSSVSRANLTGLPSYEFIVSDSCGQERTVITPDPGLMLSDPWTIPELELPPRELCLAHPAVFAGFFKIPSLRGISKTAPYFHDHSARTLEEAVAFYNFHFANGSESEEDAMLLTEQDIADIVAFLKLL